MLFDDLAHERQIEVTAQARELEDHEKHAQEEYDADQSLVAPDEQQCPHCKNRTKTTLPSAAAAISFFI